MMRYRAICRRDFLQISGGAVAAACLPSAMGADAAREDLIEKIARTVVREGRKGGVSWFHPRACLVPGEKPRVFMTVQSITGSDVFGPVHWSESVDSGATWSDPAPIPNMGRRPAADGLEEGVCDVVPEYHARTKSVLAMGHNVFYRRNALFRPQPARHPVYVVRDCDGKWSEPRALAWNDARGSAIYTCGCGQRVTLESGGILIPISFGPKDRAVATARCTFDGRELVIREVGKELRKAVKRGLLEPSMTVLDGRYYLTIRAEDGRGYVSACDDGMNWPDPVAWAWDDGTPLDMSTTQQHWLTHSAGLHLVYTRKDSANANVFRWRAPLYAAQVDRKALRLIKSTEKIVLPLLGDGIKAPKAVAMTGNFHVVNVNARESLVTDGEMFPGNGYQGDLLQARISWARPNQLK